uniref:Uncharacterized protein n=1 Tax=Oryza brachyantha TaxID=4533 RepID=J3MH04_ORYBR
MANDVIQAKLVGTSGGLGSREDEHRGSICQRIILRLPGVDDRCGVLLAGAVHGRGHREARHLGHCRPRTLPQPCSHVLPRRRRRRRRLRYLQHGFVHSSKEVGRRAPEARESPFGDGISWQQGRSGGKEADWNPGGDGIRRAKRPLLHRDVGQDVAERHRALLRTRLMKMRPHRPSGMVLHDGRRRRAAGDGGGRPWLFCCSG